MTARIEDASTRAAPRSASWPRRAAAALVAAVVVLVGTWVTGGLLTDDPTAAMLLTGGWLTVAGGAALVALYRWRGAALPLFVAVAITAGAVGSWLLAASTVDAVADEDVVTAAEAAAVAGGRFQSDAHETRGEAALLRDDDGGLVLTLTGFATDPGPDLRVHLVPSGAAGVDGGVDLGALKGNRGEQQYAVPEGAPQGRVVIWCRAFSVSFGSAELAAA